LLQLYGTAPPSDGRTPAQFRERVLEVAQWTDASSFRGLLIFTDHYSVDQWAAAQFMIERTERVVPLVAAQPAYMHPYTAARMVSSLSFMYGRPVDLNLVVGSNPHHLSAVGSRLDHDQRYDQLAEFGNIMIQLLTDPDPMTHAGDYYDFPEALLMPSLPAELRPTVFVSGSSPACVRAQRAMGVVRLTYPRPIAEYEPGTSLLDGAGIRVGIIARDTTQEAWGIAHRRFPQDPMGERLQEFGTRVTDSLWYHRLSGDAARPREADGCYWLYPFRAAKEYCPYLVGSHTEVSELLARYLEMGITTLIMQAPVNEDDIPHAEIALRRAQSVVTNRRGGSPSPAAAAAPA
jgi:alkanesulfonate monooxygenase